MNSLITQEGAINNQNMANLPNLSAVTSTPRKFRLKLGVRQKVMLVLLTVLLTALSVSGWLALRAEHASLIDETNLRGAEISRYVAKSLSISIAGYDIETVQLMLDELTSSDEISYAAVSNMQGNIMSESGISYKNSSSNAVVTFKQKILIDKDQVGNLELGLSTARTLERLENQKFILLKREALIILLIALGEFIALSYIIVRPVSKITEYLRNNIDKDGHLVESIPVITNDEFGHMANQFNALTSQINEANKKLQSKVEVADRQLLETNKQLKQLNEEFKLLSITDPLTGLFNRRHFDELMTTEIGLSNRHGDDNSVLLIDIDFFKGINDTYGHYVGDAVLKSLTSTLVENLRQTDAVCRIGGEEFAVLCKRADANAAMEISEKLRKAVESTPLAKDIDDELVVTISIGIASVPNMRGSNTPELLFKDMDNALYYSKNHGRNCCTHADLLHSENKAQQG
jgi:diguanylate cyclase (GGDEF)-like protein